MLLLWFACCLCVLLLQQPHPRSVSPVDAKRPLSSLSSSARFLCARCCTRCRRRRWPTASGVPFAHFLPIPPSVAALITCHSSRLPPATLSLSLCLSPSQQPIGSSQVTHASVDEGCCDRSHAAPMAVMQPDAASLSPVTSADADAHVRPVARRRLGGPDDCNVREIECAQRLMSEKEREKRRTRR